MAFSINLERVREVLEEWASESEQRRLWLSDGSNGAEVSSFVEARECLFTDTGLGLELDKGRVVFNQQIDQMLAKLDLMLSKVDGGRPHDQIIADARMHEVRLLAARLLHLLPAPSA